MNLRFEWDEVKAATNRSKHDIDFEEAATIFGDALALTIYDPLHSVTEMRYVTLGESARGRLLVVVHTYRKNAIRLISAREATRRERLNYERGR